MDKKRLERFHFKSSGDRIPDPRFLLDTVVESVPVVLFAVDGEGVFTFSDGKALEVLDLEPGEVVGRSVFELYRHTPEVGENVIRALSGEVFVAVVEVEGAVFECRYGPLKDGDGTVVGAVGVAANVTARRRAEKALHFRDRAIAACSEGIVITDPNQPDDPIVYVNSAFERTTGYVAEEVLGRNCRFLQGEDCDQPPLDELRAALREGRVCRVVLKNYKKDGTPFWNELSVSPVRDEEGQLVNFVGVQKDVTERRQWEERLQESEERFRATFEAAAVGMAHVATDGRWLRVNGKLLEILGYPREELVGLTFQDITHPNDLSKDLEHVNRMVLGEIETYSIEKRYFRKDRSRIWVNLTVSMVRARSSESEYFVSVIEDITERKLKELVPDELTLRELEVLRLVARWQTDREIADHLSYSVGTVKRQVSSVIAKLGVGGRRKAASHAVEIGLIPPLR